MLVLAIFYYSRYGRWLIVGVLGFLLALTRPTGALILLPVLYEYVHYARINKRKLFDYQILYLALIPLGLGLFALYNYHLTGDFLAFAHVQAMWGRSLRDPLRVLIGGFLSPHGTVLFSAIFTIIAAGLVAAYYKILRPSYLLYCIYSLLVPLASGLDSMPRYILVIFPLFLILAYLSKTKWITILLVSGLFVFQCYLMIYWTIGADLIK